MQLSMFIDDPARVGESIDPEIRVNWASRGLLDGVYVRSVDVFDLNNKHGVAYEPFTSLGYLAGKLRGCFAGTALLDPFDYSPRSIAHCAASFAILSAGVPLRLGIGVRHDQANAAQKTRLLPSALRDLDYELRQAGRSMNFDRSQISLGIVGYRASLEVMESSARKLVSQLLVPLRKKRELEELRNMGPPVSVCLGVELNEVVGEDSLEGGSSKRTPDQLTRLVHSQLARLCDEVLINPIAFETARNAWEKWLISSRSIDGKFECA